MQAIILAGGKGTRLRPFTAALPKPLIPVGDMPILEVVLRQLRHYGADRITIAVNHLAHLIMAFFGNGEKLGLSIEYSLEEQPLGTAGPLGLIEDLDQNFLVLNGDLLSTIDYAQLFRFHADTGADITVGLFRKNLKIELGVITTAGEDLVDYVEKPTYSFDVSMGIYAMRRSVIDLLNKGERLDLPQLVLRARDDGRVVKCFTGDYQWLDIGRPDDYETAVSFFTENRKAYLPDE